MNWLGFDLRAYLAALAGALVGCLVFGALFPLGAPTPLVVGLCAGLGGAAGARDKSSMRGLVVAGLAIWAGAIAEVAYAPIDPGGLAHNLARFNELVPRGVGVWHLASGVIAWSLARLSFRRDAGRRVAGA